jgi:hypothetical protein
MIVLSSSSLRFERSKVPSCNPKPGQRDIAGRKLLKETYPLFGEFPCFLILCDAGKSQHGHLGFMCARTFEFLNNSITRRSYAEKPATSRTIDRTSFVFADRLPLRWLGRAAFSIGVVVWPCLRPRRESAAHSVRRSFLYNNTHHSLSCFYVERLSRLYRRFFVWLFKMYS